ncbi:MULTISPECIES: hypothetical protein [Alphaproteobacteria]|uniref:Uncharacterized protein n=2 Tax=Alphaproteobacteria TaxID=28211 RepID=A0A512HIC9_9HYPH|nr:MULTISPECIES: hypothetical protein [Alphaproteobacteria]GEO85192.1 hypothetical protein RNA01_21240 [Ciceribacter naphthalenivorans]GLR24474.1 hypothetical protein GCM10007920_42680 [Ciceribacter naphthalenivorans]GLT07330.1 hypothetical protein GCM10007926_42680 [Sphingomonas psychrolutea]
MLRAVMLRAGSALALTGLVAIAVAYALSGQARWVDFPLASLITAERLLPLVGLGLLLGQMRGGGMAVAMALFVVGAGLGIAFREVFFVLAARLPGAGAHMFLTGPIACVLIGVPLVLPRAIRPWFAFPLLAPAAAVLAIATLLGDPTLHARSYLPSALAVEAWLIVSIAFLVSGFYRPWLAIAVRIFASWLIAIGLLYGGAYVASKRTAPEPPPFPAMSGADEDEGFGPILKQLDGAGK